MQIGISQNIGMELSAELSVMLNPKMLQTLKILNMPYAELIEKISSEAEINPLIEIEKRDGMMEYLRYQSSLPVREKEGQTADPAEMERYLKAGTTLSQFLLTQLALLDTTEEQKEILELLIKNLDENGYILSYDDLKTSIEKDLKVSGKEIDQALKALQSFEPDGVAARNLKESLLIQINEYNFESEELKTILETIVNDHLDDLGKGDLSGIAIALSIPEEGVKMAADFIKGHLTPYPGARFAETSTPAIPSFAVKKTAYGYEIVNLETKYGPSIKLNVQYQKMLNDPSTDEKTASYIMEKLSQAKELVEQITKRHETVEKIVSKIVERQRNYLEGLTKFPEPMTQKELSEKFGIHPSTVSRAVAEKYIETPIGVLKMKSLCPRQTMGLTAAHIKSEIAEVLSGEDMKRPFTDAQIIEKLSDKGINLKRRTVSDYRKKLLVDTSIKRKRK
ncbi:MAG: RNA polymerase factor sigma-54 [Candidatus Margulisiibacteriota bacterium]